MSEALQPVFAIEKIYLKDLSVEAPNTPEIFSEREAPTVEDRKSTRLNSSHT